MPKPVLYGFLQLRDVIQQPITDAMLPRINTAITATLAEYNRQLTALLALFSVPTTKFKLRYSTALSKSLQALDENGRARITKGVGFYDVAFPLFAGGDAWGINYVAEQKMVVQTINDWLYSTLAADRAFISGLLLQALLADRSWVFDDPEHGALTILPLANGDAQEYTIRVGATGGATDSHLLAQADPISDAHNPFRGIRFELIEHPENGGVNADIIALCPTAQMNSIESLAGFHEPRDIDVTPALGQAFLSNPLAVPVPGRMRGKVDHVWIVEWPTLPDDHIIAVPTGAGGDPALAQRQHEQAALQGFFELPERLNTPYRERQFQRHTGFGTQNRVGALALQIGSNAFSTPVGYETPLN